VTMRRNTYLRSYVSHFIGLLAPELTPELIRGELRGQTQAAKPTVKAGAAKRRQQEDIREEKK